MPNSATSAAASGSSKTCAAPSASTLVITAAASLGSKAEAAPNVVIAAAAGAACRPALRRRRRVGWSAPLAGAGAAARPSGLACGGGAAGLLLGALGSTVLLPPLLPACVARRAALGPRGARSGGARGSPRRCCRNAACCFIPRCLHTVKNGWLRRALALRAINTAFSRW
ncbi:MAG: hypothetical protein J3K34DRAFT_430400 [Monoraphidium minutum]|nr:MAG: hypothetical protein J3K34DRAFT_430400 [Monoraphidium minutum]